MRKCVDVHGNMCMGIHGIKRMKISGLLNENEQNKCMWGGEYTQHKHEATTIQYTACRISGAGTAHSIYGAVPLLTFCGAEVPKHAPTDFA